MYVRNKQEDDRAETKAIARKANLVQHYFDITCISFLFKKLHSTFKF